MTCDLDFVKRRSKLLACDVVQWDADSHRYALVLEVSTIRQLPINVGVIYTGYILLHTSYTGSTSCITAFVISICVWETARAKHRKLG